MLVAALIGLAFGFLGSIPVAGPIAAHVLKRGLEGRAASGAWIGLGCAVAEGGYAFLAFWGFSTYLVRYPLLEPISRGVAAVILLALGITFVRYRVAKRSPDQSTSESVRRSLLVGFTVTALNPTLIATWTGATTTLYSTGLSVTPAGAPTFALGATVGIAGWFGLISWLLHRYRERFREETLARFVRGVGWLILVLAVGFTVRLVQGLLGAV